jgi:hypothetical protein
VNLGLDVSNEKLRSAAGMQLSEGGVPSRVRVHHVCTENADATIWLLMGADMILEKPA